MFSNLMGATQNSDVRICSSCSRYLFQKRCKSEDVHLHVHRAPTNTSIPIFVFTLSMSSCHTVHAFARKHTCVLWFLSVLRLTCDVILLTRGTLTDEEEVFESQPREVCSPRVGEKSIFASRREMENVALVSHGRRFMIDVSRFL